ncbi:hypothetical protein [Crenothrix polyspora]|uniref:Methanolan biosynthesis EpsI domain-containing protein n=1 Tax=Crenothrix polyspora TaxID=360316 RepID=A0A1R4HHT9_9GAMM|nr:hypothetical protein [Crenothrix polyspora]SJM95785.1 conserved hypothetical protein [Crenothrix polyspora]
MICSRYAVPVAVFLSLALIPTVIHNYLGLAVDNTATPHAIKADLGEFISVPTRRNIDWGMDMFGCVDWFERTYKDKQGNTARLFVGRAYDHKRLYHHPELALSYGNDLRNDGKIILSGGHAISVTLLHHNTQANIAAYALFYNGYFIDDPIAHQIKNAIKLLVSAEKPMTLFYVSEDNTDKHTPFEKTMSAKLLKAAIQSFLAQQPTPTS